MSDRVFPCKYDVAAATHLSHGANHAAGRKNKLPIINVSWSEL